MSSDPMTMTPPMQSNTLPVSLRCPWERGCHCLSLFGAVSGPSGLWIFAQGSVFQVTLSVR